MADIEDIFPIITAAHAGLKALIGARIYPIMEAPQDAALPYCTYQRVSDGAQAHVMGSDDGPCEPRFQVNCYDDDYAGAKAVAVQVKDAFRDYSGTVASMTVQRIMYEGQIDGFDEQSECHVHSVDLRVLHAE